MIHKITWLEWDIVFFNQTKILFCALCVSAREQSLKENIMKIKVVVHEAEEDGFWAEVPAIPGCATQGETFEELSENIYEAVESAMSIDVSSFQMNGHDRVLEVAV